MSFLIKKRGAQRLGVQPDYTLVGDDKIICLTAWTSAEGRRQERCQVLTIWDGKIIDMQGCRSRREAEHFARRH